jgi:hypothetical protein
MILHKMNTVAFDPANKQHRKAVALFMKRNAWADSPIRFSYDPEFGSVADQVKSKMLTWYISRETVKPAAKVVTASAWRAAGEAKTSTPRSILAKVA